MTTKTAQFAVIHNDARESYRVHTATCRDAQRDHKIAQRENGHNPALCSLTKMDTTQFIHDMVDDWHYHASDQYTIGTLEHRIETWSHMWAFSEVCPCCKKQVEDMQKQDIAAFKAKLQPTTPAAGARGSFQQAFTYGEQLALF